ncbi:CLUMA_CG001625, isoform A [Clunio marinus]|uniref:CLUMA_CG001625, isoform A n=1 Tax=Clunio marinus TaxID=568069 RepID=A0A1J1HIK0_9DIPT|nr:CLUMA_CG001625, isoform A [Clunio marinus]
MERTPSDEALTETIKTLIISRKCPMTIAQVKHDYEELEGKNIPELKIKSLMRFSSTFHMIKPENGEERFDIRYDARARMMRGQKPIKKFNPAMMKSPAVPRTRYTITVNNNNAYQKNLNGNGSMDVRQKLLRNPQPMPKLTMPLSERLKRRGELSPEDIEAANVVKVPDTWFMTAGGSYEKLLNYCQNNNFDPPELKFLDNPLAKGSFKCQVMINGVVYTSYKDFFQSQQEAQEACCKIAVQELKREEELSQNPLDISNDHEIMKKIWQMIRSSIGGVFIKHVANLYIDTYKLSLPENWHEMSLQYEGNLFSFETNAFNEPIIFAKPEADTQNESTKTISTNQKIAKLEFPWNEKLWNVFVTSAFSTNDICGRLIGEKYSDALDKLLTDIEIAMMSHKERPKEIKLSHIYLTAIAECYHRIKVVEINERQAYCICIDNGDYEWISFDDIYSCNSEFLTVAPQAFKLSLFGLEEFEKDPNVSQQPLFQPLVFKSLVGEIMTEKNVWDKSSTSSSSAIPMILYDTSTDEDINLNETLMNTILRSIPIPTLHQKESNQVIVTSIGDDAIYCQLVKSSIYIQQLISDIPKNDLKKHRGFYLDKADKKKIYLVSDVKGKNWFRARLERFSDDQDQLMYYIDHGYKATVKIENIYRLDKLSIVLFSYPPQVLKFGLFNVQITSDVKKRLMALLPSRRQALVKVVTMGNGGLPLVHLFTYICHQDETIMIKINDQFATSLGTELHSFSPNDPLIKLEQRRLKNNGEFIKIHVILVSSPQNFVIQLQDDIVELNNILNEMQLFCNGSDKFKSLEDIKKGECYAVYDEDTRKWVRASAENVINADFIHCLCFDSGNFKTLSLDKMRTLPNQFRKMPKLALKAKLFGVKPKHKDFTPDDAIHFKVMTENKTFPAVIKNITSDRFDQELYEIVLFGKDEKIHETLVKENRALPI